MRIFGVLVVIVSLTFSVACDDSTRSEATAMVHMAKIRMGPTREAEAERSQASAIHSISLPHDEAFAPPGPGREAFVTACIVCHSPRYITSQPPFSRTVWKGIVQKMIETYGAHITAPQAAEIVDYLVATNGANSIGDEK